DRPGQGAVANSAGYSVRTKVPLAPARGAELARSKCTWRSVHRGPSCLAESDFRRDERVTAQVRADESGKSESGNGSGIILPISNCRFSIDVFNWQSTIGNRQ